MNSLLSSVRSSPIVEIPCFVKDGKQSFGARHRAVVAPPTLLAARDGPGGIQPRERLTNRPLAHAQRGFQVTAAGALVVAAISRSAP